MSDFNIQSPFVKIGNNISPAVATDTLVLPTPLAQSSGGTGSSSHTERWCGTAGGTANALTLTPTPAITSYVAGQEFIFVASATNTTAATIAISGLSALNLTMGNVALPIGGLISGNTYVALVESGTSIRVSPYDAASVNGDTINGGYTFIGTADMDLPSYGAEFLTGTGWTSTGWTGSWAGGWVHTVGNTSVLSYPTAAVNATRYQIAYTVTGRTAGSFTVAFGGQSLAAITATGAFGPVTTSTANLTVTPTTDFDGTIVISIKAVTAVSNPIATYKSSDGTSRVEIRANSTLNNLFVGVAAGRWNTTGSSLTFAGHSAGFSNSTGSSSTALGNFALYSNINGLNNVAIGVQALYSNVSSSGNTAIGTFAMLFNTGTSNTAVGNAALYQNTSANFSTAIGASAGQNSTGTSNSYLGAYSGFNQVSGTNGCYVGTSAGRYLADGATSLTTSSNSVYLGYGSRGTNSDNNSIVIGANAISAGANTVVIGDDNIIQTYLKGSVNLTSQNTGQLAGFRNKIINGAMQISQRGTSFPAIVNTAYSLDRYINSNTSTAVYTISQDTTVYPSGFNSSLKVLLTTADAAVAAPDVCGIIQKIEGSNLVGLNFGLATAKNITLSFWVYSNVAGTYSGTIINSLADRSYVFEYIINVANTWEKKTITLAADTTGTWTTTTGLGCYVVWTLMAGADYQGTVNTWQAGNKQGTINQINWAASLTGGSGGTAPTFYLTGVQLEQGSQATPFEFRSYGTELALCQRYLPALSIGDQDRYYGFANSTTLSYISIPFQVRPRVVPTGISVSNVGHYTIYDPKTGTGATTNIVYGASGFIMGQVQVTTTAGAPTLIAGDSVLFYSNNAASQILWTGCEL